MCQHAVYGICKSLNDPGMSLDPDFFIFFGHLFRFTRYIILGQGNEVISLNCFLTGPPRCGKTTIIKEIIERLGESAAGFYTEEMRRGGRRVGFSLKTLSGEQGTLSHIDFKSKHRVGKYGVNLDALDKIGSREIERALDQNKVVIIDEIGKMELFSNRFRDAVHRALDSESPVVGTIMFVKHPFADEIKRRKDVNIVDVSKKSKTEVVDTILKEINAA
jgi:nucleoside-triphosphatase